MQFRKNTSRDKFFNISFMLKTIIAIFIIVFGFILINQINLPAPIKQIEKFYQMKILKQLSKILFSLYLFLFVQNSMQRN